MGKKLNNSATIKFNIEGSEKECAFFAIYAGLRMYKEQKDAQPKEPGTFSLAAAEAYCMIEQMRERFPEETEEASLGYDESYGGMFTAGYKVLVHDWEFEEGNG